MSSDAMPERPAIYDADTWRSEHQVSWNNGTIGWTEGHIGNGDWEITETPWDGLARFDCCGSHSSEKHETVTQLALISALAVRCSELAEILTVPSFLI